MGLFNKSGRHYKQPALWKRIIKWTVLSLLAIGITVGLAGFIFVYRTLGKIGEDTELIYAAQQQLDVLLPDEPMNILVLGADEDPDGTAKRSDTIMLVRVNPQGESLSILSMPRDMIVDIPEVGPDKINTAYAIGDVPLAIDTVRELTDLPIHHFVLIDYGGFEKAIDAMSGVYVDVDRRYFNDNSDAYYGESYEPIDIYPGYQKLNGKDALSYVRFRHTDSDFMRIARQQYFIRDAKAQSLKWGNITMIPEMADVFASNTSSDIGRTDILSLTKFVLTVDKENIFQAQVPVLEDFPGGPMMPDTAQLEQILEKFLNPDFQIPQPAVPGEAAPEVPAAATKQLPVEVRNGSGEEGVAAAGVELLKQKGFTQVTLGGNTQELNATDANEVYYAKGSEAAAAELCTLLEPCQASAITAEISTKAQLLVVIGTSFSGALTQPQPPAQSLLTFVDNPDDAWDDWKGSAQRLGFQLEKPTTFPAEFDYVDFHIYEIQTDDGPRQALKVVCEDEVGNNWGIMETNFHNAPLLDNPSAERQIAGKNYRFYYAGASLRYISWQDGDVAYWISNSLRNSLTEETMIKLAVSFDKV